MFSSFAILFIDLEMVEISCSRFPFPSLPADVFMPDTIQVKATISDDRAIETVQYGLLGLDGISVGQRVSVDIVSNPMTFNLTLDVIDKRIKSEHNLEVLASDGENVSRDFQAMNITEIPQRYLGSYVVSDLGNSSEVQFINLVGAESAVSSSLSIEPRLLLDYIEEWLFVVESDQVERFGYGANEPDWTSTLMLAAGEHIVDAEYESMRRKIYILTDARRLVTIDSDGVNRGSINFQSVNEVLDIEVNGNMLWLLAEVSGTPVLQNVLLATGSEIEEFVLDQSCVQMEFIDEDHMAVVTDSDDLLLVDLMTGGEIFVPVPAASEVLDMKVAGFDVLLLTDNQLFRYSASSFQVTGIYQGSQLTDVSFDPVNQRVLITEANVLRFFNYIPWQLAGA